MPEMGLSEVSHRFLYENPAGPQEKADGEFGFLLVAGRPIRHVMTRGKLSDAIGMEKSRSLTSEPTRLYRHRFSIAI